MDQSMADAIRLYMPRAIRLYAEHARLTGRPIRRG